MPTSTWLAQLYFVLVMLVQDKALGRLKSAPDSLGLEAWRIPVGECEPKSRGRFGGMLIPVKLKV